MNRSRARRSALLLSALLGVAGASAESLAPGLAVERLADGVYLVTHSYPWPSNSLLAVMGDGRLLMVDTPYTPEATATVLRWARARLGEREVVAITTHFHIDRLGGNAELARRGIPIYGSTLTPAAIAERGARSAAALAATIGDPVMRAYFESFEYVAPDHLFDPREGLTLDFGGEEARVEYPGVGHSVDNLVVYLPGKRLLFGGCMLLAAEARSVGNVADGDLGGWIGSLALVETEGYDLVVPGHGRPGGPLVVSRTAELLQAALGR